MSGGSYDYKFCVIDDYYVGEMHDAELDEMMKDIVELLHDLEWWQSADIGEEDYRNTVRAFKDKWFNAEQVERLKPIIDTKINRLRTELMTMIGEIEP